MVADLLPSEESSCWLGRDDFLAISRDSKACPSPQRFIKRLCPAHLDQRAGWILLLTKSCDGEEQRRALLPHVAAPVSWILEDSARGLL